MRGSRNLLCGIDVGLRYKRIERNGQEHHAQEKCAARANREAAGLCSLLPRQQLSIQRENAAAGASYSIQEPITKSASRLSAVTASSPPAHWMKTNIMPFEGASRKDAGQERCRRCAALDASGPQRRVRALARPLQYLSRRVTPSLDFDAARSAIVTPSRCWSGRRRSFCDSRYHEHERNLQQQLPRAQLLAA